MTTTPPPGHGPLTPEIREANTRIAMNPGAAQGITPAAGPVTVTPTAQAAPPTQSVIVVVHGDDDTVPRPNAGLVMWVGAATPDNGLAYDFWYTADL